MDEASAIIEIAKGIVPNFEAALSAIVEQKNVDLVPIVPGPLAYSILEILDESTINLANSLIELVPVCILSIAGHTFLTLILNLVV